MDHCKTFFVAGHETTATSMSWSLVLLAQHPEWQDRARAEIRSVCGGAPPDLSTLAELKVVRKGCNCHQILFVLLVLPLLKDSLSSLTGVENRGVWQARARAEIRSVCGGAPPDLSTLAELKVVG